MAKTRVARISKRSLANLILQTADGGSATRIGGFVWIENTGFGEFQNRHAISSSAVGLYTQAIAAADLDGDGDIDLVSDRLLDSRGIFSWLENRQVGDSSNDGVFNSSDLAVVFAADKFETGTEATFDEGEAVNNSRTYNQSKSCVFLPMRMRF